MVVEAKFVVDDAVINVIRLDQVLQCSCSLLGSFFDVVDLCFGDFDAATWHAP